MARAPGAIRQAQILRYIETATRENGYAPSVREICVGVGLSSTSTTHYHLTALRRAGLISFEDNRNRSVRLTGEDRCPRCGAAHEEAVDLVAIARAALTNEAPPCW